jgi:hypothetical protein
MLAPVHSESGSYILFLKFGIYPQFTGNFFRFLRKIYQLEKVGKEVNVKLALELLRKCRNASDMS